MASTHPTRFPIPILLYHSISDQAASRFARWVVPPALFDTHMAYLKEANYSSFTVTDFISRMDHPSSDLPLKPVLITFDDGFADFYDQALPVLTRYGLKATVYISTHYVGGTSQWLAHDGEAKRQMLSWEQVRDLAEHGIECGAHGHLHQQLDILPPEIAYQNIVDSKYALEQHLPGAIHSFAYPHGYYSPSLRRLVQMAGFSSACAVKHALSSTEDDPFSLARLIISPDIDLDRFRLMLEGKNLPVAPYPERVKTKAWRGMRWLLSRVNNLNWMR